MVGHAAGLKREKKAGKIGSTERWRTDYRWKQICAENEQKINEGAKRQAVEGKTASGRSYTELAKAVNAMLRQEGGSNGIR
jgi:hypothetical protein